MEYTTLSSRVGVMIRNTLAADSAHVFMGMAGGTGFRWVRRITAGGSPTTSSSSTGTVPNTWVRIVRAGNVITAYRSTNGTSWTSAGSMTATFANSCFIGLWNSSGSNTTTNTSVNGVNVVP